VRDNKADLRVIGEQLGVRHVLEGSVRKAGTRLRITAQLIESANGYHVWSERYDRDLVDVFALQDDIANAIATKLRLSLLSGSGDGAERAGPRNVEAYELLLKGRVLLWQRGRAILEALPCFERAVALDPELTEAHALIGDASRLLCIYGMAPASATIPRALDAIDRALALDPENAQALTTMANIQSTYYHDAEASVALSDRVLARNPLNVQALCERGLILALRSVTSQQRMVQALHHLSTARRADPLNAWAAALEAISLSCAGLPDDALSSAREAMAIDGKAFTARWALVWTLSALRHDEEAMALAEETLPMSGRNPFILAELAAIRARRGEMAAVRAILDELRQRAESGYVEQSIIGAVCASAGEIEEARALVQRGMGAHENSWQFAQGSPAWASFKADAAGAEMVRAEGF
jgi:tetratricopeptide (TPR) repeat protein